MIKMIYALVNISCCIAEIHMSDRHTWAVEFMEKYGISVPERIIKWPLFLTTIFFKILCTGFTVTGITTLLTGLSAWKKVAAIGLKRSTAAWMSLRLNAMLNEILAEFLSFLSLFQKSIFNLCCGDHASIRFTKYTISVFREKPIKEVTNWPGGNSENVK